MNLSEPQQKALRDLDEWFPKIVDSPAFAIRDLSEIIGLVIGVKHAALDMFLPSELEKVNQSWFKKKLHALGLHVIFERRALGGNDPMNFGLYYYLSTTHEDAIAAQKLFHKIWSGEWSFNRELGLLLGYPPTAVDYFLSRKPENDTDEDRDRILRNRFYVHSKKHEDAEFNAYEKPIYDVIRAYCPRVYNIMNSEPAKRNA